MVVFFSPNMWVVLIKTVTKIISFRHQGIYLIKPLTGNCIYRFDMDKYLNKLLQTCSNCRRATKFFGKLNCLWLVPESLWSRLHFNFAGPIKVQNLSILIDAYSKWPEVFTTNYSTSGETRIKWQQIFNRFGWQDILVSSNEHNFPPTAKKTAFNTSGLSHSTHNWITK